MTITFDIQGTEYHPMIRHGEHLSQLLDHWPRANPSWPMWLQKPKVLPVLCKELRAIKRECKSQRISRRVTGVWNSLNQSDWIGARHAVAELAALLTCDESLSDDELWLAATGVPGHSPEEGGKDVTD